MDATTKLNSNFLGRILRVWECSSVGSISLAPTGPGFSPSLHQQHGGVDL